MAESGGELSLGAVRPLAAFVIPRLDNGSRMTRERHVRFCERLAVKFRRPTYQRKTMIERDGEVSVKRQAQLLDLSRSSVYYVARDLPERDLKLMRILDELHLKWPFYGARKLTRELQKPGPRGRPPACDDADAADGHGDDLP